MPNITTYYLEDQNHVITLTDVEKAFEKKQYPFIIKKKKTKQSSSKRELSQTIKHIYEKSPVNIILNCESFT